MQFKALLVFWESLIKWRYQKCELNVSQLRNPIYSLHELWGWTVYVCMFLTWSPWFKETSKSIENNDESVESVRCKRNPPTFRKVNQTSCPLLSCHLPHCMLGLNSPAPQILILWQPTILLVAFIALTKLSSLQMLLVRVNLIKKRANIKKFSFCFIWNKFNNIGLLESRIHEQMKIIWRNNLSFSRWLREQIRINSLKKKNYNSTK